MHNLLPDYNAKVITNPQYLEYKDMALQFLNAINSFFLSQQTKMKQRVLFVVFKLFSVLFCSKIFKHFLQDSRVQ